MARRIMVILISIVSKWTPTGSNITTPGFTRGYAPSPQPHPGTLKGCHIPRQSVYAVELIDGGGEAQWDNNGGNDHTFTVQAP